MAFEDDYEPITIARSDLEYTFTLGSGFATRRSSTVSILIETTVCYRMLNFC
jgi:hypothetical protein